MTNSQIRKNRDDLELVTDYYLLEGKRLGYIPKLMEAIKNYESALELSERLQDQFRQIQSLYQLSYYYRWLTNKEQVNRIVNLVKPLSNSTNEIVASIALVSLGDYYHYISDNDSAFICYNKPLKVLKTLDNKFWVIHAYQGIGWHL